MEMNNLNPPIWKGRDYEDNGIFGSRILIVGESTYTTNGADTSLYNVWMAQDHIDGYRDAFRTKLIRVFLNTDYEQKDDIEKFWNSVCYLNFIIPALSGPRIAPNDRMWVDNSQPLSKLLAELKPNLVVVLGYRMWSEWINTPPCEMLPGPIIEGAGRAHTYFLISKGNEHRSLSYAMKHPSSGFSWRREHQFLMQAIKISKG